MHFRFLLVIAFVCVALGSASAQPSPAPVLIKIIDAKGVTVLGELTAENEESVELIELKTGKKRAFQKSALNDFRKGISEKEAAGTIGLAEFLVWRIRRVIPSNSLNGKVAQIDSSAIYVTFGSQVGIEKGQELIVQRGDQEIKNPDTGEVLGLQKRRIARLTVIETMEKLSKCKLVGDLDVELKVGDSVEPASQSRAIAVLPLVDLNGCVRAGGKKLGEDLTTGLVQGGITIVERTLLAKVLMELGLQNTKVFDAGTAQKIGRQLGAYAILTGTLTPSGNKSDANLRLIKVETGEILFASPLNGPSLGGIIVCGADVIIIPPNGSGPPTVIPPGGGSPSLPDSGGSLVLAPGWKSLFNGKDLTGWKLKNPHSTAEWRVGGGGMLVGTGPAAESGRDIYTDQRFWNFTLKCEFVVSPGGIGRILLRGRHRIAIREATQPAQRLQTIEATIMGNRLTVILNNVKIHDRVELIRASPLALDTNLQAPGPILFQVHGGIVRFRNIQIREIR